MALTKYAGTGIFLSSYITGYSLDEYIMPRYNTYMCYFYTGHPRNISVWCGISDRVSIFQPTDGVKVCL